MEIVPINPLRKSQREDKDAPTIRVYRAKPGLSGLELAEVWRHRQIVYFLCWRQLASRFRVPIIGVMWSAFQPLSIAFISAFFFGKLANMPSGGSPYPLFIAVGIVTWQYLANVAVSSATAGQAFGDLLTRIYFPRLILPLSIAIGPILDLAIALSIVITMMLIFSALTLGLPLLALPIFIVLEIVTALGMAAWFCAFSISYSESKHLIPLSMQIWMLASPVFYPSSIVPANLRQIYHLNPAATVLDGLRWSLLGQTPPSPIDVLLSTVSALLLSLTGLLVFKTLSRRFSDVL